MDKLEEMKIMLFYRCKLANQVYENSRTKYGKNHTVTQIFQAQHQTLRDLILETNLIGEYEVYLDEWNNGKLSFIP